MRKVFLRKITLMSALALLLCSASAMGVSKMSSKAAEGDVEINETNFPDEVFRNYVLDEIDIDDDGVLSVEEQANTSTIFISNMGLTDAKGIEYFTNLIALYLPDNKLTSIDVSANVKLDILYIHNNADISSLNVSKNLELTELEISYTQISDIDLSKNTDLKELVCNKTNIVNLDLSQNSNLYSVNCKGNDNLISLKLPKSTELRELDCSDTSISELDISANTGLEYLNCGNCRIKSLDLSNQTNLTTLNCSAIPYSGYGLTSLVVPDTLHTLKCSYNKLEELDVSKATDLRELQCVKCGLTSLDISNNSELLELMATGNDFSGGIDVSKNTKLTSMELGECGLSDIGLSKNTDLQSIDLSNNKITSIDLSAFTGFKYLYLSGNEYSVVLNSDNTFDLTTLPGNFDVNRASGWSGGTVSGNILTVDDGATMVTYIYDEGLGYNETFTLNVNAHNYVEAVDDKYLKSEADCTNAAVYYKSCSKCNIAGTETFISGAPLGHDYKTIKNNETNHWHVCSRCEETDVKEAHTYGTDNKCSVCGYEKEAPTTEATTEATTTEATTQAPVTEAATTEAATTETANTDNAVATGDEANPAAMAGVMIFAMAGILMIVGKLKFEKE